MNKAVASDFENPAFFDPFACYREAVKGARRRNHRYLATLLAGDREGAAVHLSLRNFYLARAREWRGMIDFTGDEE